MPNNSQRDRINLILAAFILVQSAGMAAAPRSLDGVDDAVAAEIKTTVYATILPDDEKGFARMGPPKPLDWRSFYKEMPQTLERYKIATRVRPTAERRVIVLQPLGEMDAEQRNILEAMREYAGIFFQTPVRIEKPLALELPEGERGLIRMLPSGNRHGIYDRQYNGETIMSAILEKHLPADAIVSLGITMSDLYSGDMNFVFGVGSFDKRVGVYSLCRYFPEFWGIRRSPGDEVIALRRACKVLNHETGHMFGLTHCVFYYCSMNGSNSLEETDSAPIHFCPLCHRKLLWNIGFDPVKRFTQLEEFYREHEMTQEADWMSARIRNWNTAMAVEIARKAGDE